MKTIVFALLMICFGASGFAQKAPQKEFTISGIMQHSDLEGGCWFLQAKDDKYELIGSAEQLQTCYVEGRPLTLSVVLRPFIASTCMMGKKVEIVEILDTVFHARDALIMQNQITGTIHRLKSGCWYVNADNNFRYELREPIPCYYRHIGRRFDKFARYLEGSEGTCHMNGVILFPLPDQPTDRMKEKTYDPR